MLALAEKQMLIQALGQVVYDEVQAAFKPLQDRVSGIEKTVANIPAPRDGKDGAPGKDGSSVTAADIMPEVEDALQNVTENIHDWTRNYVMGALEALPKPERGEKGEKGDNGETGAKGERGEAGLKGERGEQGPPGERGEKGEPGEPGAPGKDGKDGVNGIDGKNVCLDDLHPYIADLVAKAVGGLPIQRHCTGGFINRAGHLFITFSDGSNSDLGEVVGRDGKDCDHEMVRSQVAAFLATIEKPKDGKDGMDGVGFDDMELEFDGERMVTFKFTKGDIVKVYDIEFPSPLFRNVWKPGAYKRADIVYRDGSMWIANKDTESVPGHLGSNWQLCTKRGRDGKDGPRGPAGPAAKVDGTKS